MIERGRFFVPGPTEVGPEVLAAMSRPMIFHRNADMEALMQRVTKGLGAVFGTRRPVHVITGSGTAAMELAVRGGSIKRVLSIVHGDFGERFAKMAESCGRSVERLKAPIGDVVPLDQVRDALKKGGFDAVTATFSETATGVLADIAGIAAIVREHPDCLLLVDAVSAAGAVAVKADAWPADAVVSASQKALALPPGLGFAAVSERFVARAKGLKDRGTYLDVIRYEEFAAKSQSPTTPAVSLLFALDVQMAAVEKEGIESRYARHAAMMRSCTSWAKKAQSAGAEISLTARDGLFSPSVTCIKVNENGSVLRAMRERGFELGGGQAELSKTSIRVGHMGDHTVVGVEAMLDVLGDVLRKL